MSGLAVEGSIPSVVTALVAFLVLVLLRAKLTVLSGSKVKEVMPMATTERYVGIRGVLETFWNVLAGYLAGQLPS